MHRILIVDDEETVRYALEELLSKHGFVPFEASGEAEAIRAVQSHDLDLILLDIVMPGPDGMETLLELKKIDPDMPVIMMTGRGDISTAVQAIKMGAYDFITKPLQTNRLIQAIQGGLERFELRRSEKQLRTSLEWIFGESAAMRTVIEQIRQIAWGNAAVVIQGETGTGKWVTAQVIHNLSKRAHLPFRSVRIGAVSEPLVEAELFGRGARGPEDQEGARKGVIESAQGGTVYIDGLRVMSSATQDKLLRTMEERRICPANMSTSVQVNVRMIMGTDTDLKTLVRRRKLTEGLHSHLSGPVITLPPLKERMEDVRFLALKFLWKASVELNRSVHELEDDTIDLLMHHSWPGNVRELENTIRRAVLSSEDGVIRPEQVKSIIEGAAVYKEPFPFLSHKTTVVEDVTGGKKAEEALEAREKDFREKMESIEDANAALKPPVAHGHQDKEMLQDTILANIKDLVFPYLQRVRSGRLTESQTAYMDMIESSLNHVISPLLQKMKGAYSRLTPTEIEVADMIRNGKKTKEIAELLNVSTGTIEGHRNGIRKKLGLSNKKANLQSYLSSL
jgi:DNA-binding NtrC family response regulator/DNA-binding CsgD family transcriptional regulator